MKSNVTLLRRLKLARIRIYQTQEDDSDVGNGKVKSKVGSGEIKRTVGNGECTKL